jgi:hypothetical protein
MVPPKRVAVKAVRRKPVRKCAPPARKSPCNKLRSGKPKEEDAQDPLEALSTLKIVDGGDASGADDDGDAIRHLYNGRMRCFTDGCWSNARHFCKDCMVACYCSVECMSIHYPKHKPSDCFVLMNYPPPPRDALHDITNTF